MNTTLISNPPYNMKWSLPPFAQLQKRFNDCELPPESNANYAFILTALEKSDRCVFILPCGILTTENKQEKEIRKYLIEKNYIESVITCPDNMFEATAIPTCILILSKKKDAQFIEMIDMSGKYEIEIREQRGQFGNAGNINRTYKKEVKVFSDRFIDEAISCISDKKNIPGYCKAVSIEDVKSRDYNLTPSKHIEFKEIETKHREYKEIINDINRVIADKNCLKLTMNESIAKSIGMNELFALLKQSEKTNRDMNKMLKFTGAEIEKESFISLSKNKNEIRFENNSKDQISTILLSIIQMWKQHIMYLNNEENRYLVELRDALLPDLMSGKFDVSELN